MNADTPIAAGMPCEVLETIVCQILAEESLTAPFDAAIQHRGSTKLHSGDVLTAVKVIDNGALALVRINGALAAIATKRLKPSEVQFT